MLSQEQKTDIGNRFIDEINRRIKTRKEVQEKLNNEFKEMQSNFEDRKKKFAEELVKKHNITGKVKEYQLWNSNTRFKIVTDSIDMTIKIPESVFAKYDTNEITKKRRELCQEIEALHSLLGCVGGFQSYFSRLFSPKSKTENILDSDLKPHIQGYIDLKRPFVCNF